VVFRVSAIVNKSLTLFGVRVSAIIKHFCDEAIIKHFCDES